MAVVLVSHDLGVVAGRTHDIAVMYAGQIVEQAPTATLFSEVRMPYTEALLSSVPRLENPSHTRLAVIGGRPPDLIAPAAGLPVRAALPVRAGTLPGRAAAARRGRQPRAQLPVLVPGRHRRRAGGPRTEPRGQPAPGRGGRHRRADRGGRVVRPARRSGHGSTTEGAH